MHRHALALLHGVPPNEKRTEAVSRLRVFVSLWIACRTKEAGHDAELFQVSALGNGSIDRSRPYLCGSDTHLNSNATLELIIILFQKSGLCHLAPAEGCSLLAAEECRLDTHC